ncbi:hypothetical protein SLA2020_025880 [Shorea laevis]
MLCPYTTMPYCSCECSCDSCTSHRLSGLLCAFALVPIPNRPVIPPCTSRATHITASISISTPPPDCWLERPVLVVHLAGVSSDSLRPIPVFTLHRRVQRRIMIITSSSMWRVDSSSSAYRVQRTARTLMSLHATRISHSPLLRVYSLVFWIRLLPTQSTPVSTPRTNCVHFFTAPCPPRMRADNIITSTVILVGPLECAFGILL